MSASKAAVTRLQKELRDITKSPLPGLHATPSPANILEWHFVLEGAADSDYAGGLYHGKLVFPPTYPFKPPSAAMLTPSGRFAPGHPICTSFTSYHPESWNPLWGVSTILLGLQSFFYSEDATTGGVAAPPAERRRLAAESAAFNARSAVFRKLFPELLEPRAPPAAAAAEGGEAAAAGAGPEAAAGPAAQQQQQAAAAGGAGEPGAAAGEQQQPHGLGSTAAVAAAAAAVAAVGLGVAAHKAGVFD